ncbi:MAG TPA: ABC transporter permease, partial [Archangium sp.]
MSRYFRLLSLQLRTSALLAAQYRVDFIVDMIISLFWTATAVIPLFVVYGDSTKRGIPGWSFGETLVV